MENPVRAVWKLSSPDPALTDHRVRDEGVFPAAGYLELIRRSFRQAKPGGDFAVPFQWGQVFWIHPFLESDPSRELEWELGLGEVTHAFQIRRKDGDHEPLCRGHLISPSKGPEAARLKVAPDRLPQAASRRYGQDELYARLEGAGIHYANEFRVLEEFLVTSVGGVGRVRGIASEAGSLHGQTCLIDALMQSALICVVEDAPLVPFSMESLILPQVLPGEFLVETTLVETGPQRAFYRLGLQVFDLAGNKIGEMSELCLKAYAPPQTRQNRVAVAASFTAEPVETSLSFWLNRAGFPHAIRFAPYNQLHQELLNPESLINQAAAGCNVLMFRLQDLQRECEHEPEPVGPPPPSAGGSRKRHRLPNGLEVAHLNAYETDYLYHEIFLEKAYLKHGIEVREGDTVIDIGANIGMFSLFLASRLERVRVYALEPSPVTFGLLSENARRHGPGKIVPINAGAGGECKSAQFTFYPQSSVFSGFHADRDEDGATIRKVVQRAFAARGLSEEATEEYIDALMKDRLGQQTFACQLKTVESVLADHCIERVDLLKVDAEKCETEILGAMTPEVWARIRQIVVEIHEGFGNSRDALVALLESKGFTVETEEEVLLGESGLFNLYARRTAHEHPEAVATPETEIESRLEELLVHLRASAQRQAAPCLLCLCPSTPRFEAELSSARIGELKHRIRDALRTVSTVHFLDVSEFHTRYQVEEVHDPDREAMGQIPYTDAYFSFLGTVLARRIYGEFQRPTKVIALDCDQTLWRGVCGEDTLDQLEISPFHQDLQRRVLERHAGGVLVALVSKNQEADVRRVFAGKPEMALKWDHIVSHRINWQSKAENLQSLAEELELGLDSFVFIDDNPVECAEVHDRLPQVLTLNLPADPGEIPGLLDHVWALDQWALTREDKNRNVFYQQSRQRSHLLKACATMLDFIAQLDLKIEVREPVEVEWTRVAQLFNRTNQFNLTGRRETEAQLREWGREEHNRCGVVRVSDRFGDYGLTGAFLYRLEAHELVLKNLALSCRILGRGVEHQVLAQIGSLARAKGKEHVLVSYVTTARNEPVRRFLLELKARLPNETKEVVFLPFPTQQLAELKFHPPGSMEHEPSRPARKPLATRPGLVPVNDLFNQWIRPYRTQRDIHRVIQSTQPAPAKPAVIEPPVPDGARSPGLEEYLAQVFRSVLKLGPQVSTEASYEALGLDSFKIIEITLRLEKDFGRLPKTLLFEYLNLGDLAAYFRRHHPERSAQWGGAAKATGAPTASPVGPGSSAEPRPPAMGRTPRPAGAAAGARGDVARGDAMELAIVGLGGRYPLAPDLATFWDNLKSARDCIRPAGPRWAYHPHFSASSQALANSYTIHGGFLEDVESFDPLLFQIAPSEAEKMDPQQRLFLQVTWETLEDAGYGAGVPRADVGVFVGIMTNTYALVGLEQVLQGAAEYPDYDHYEIPNRVSFFFDFTGPSLAVDTACSSSLTAIHLACESIRRGECSSALAGGVNLILHPGRYVQYCQKHMLSPDGRSKAFGAEANGFADGEGAGCVYIKPIDQAVADGDNIYAVIKASHIGTQGRTSGFTVPNPAAQRDLIARTLAKGGIDPRTISYVEAHGTGTALGDPIEIRGLSEAFRLKATGQRACAIGSVKTNIGHLEAAAGIAGLTKVLLQMRHRQLVPSLHAEQLNPNIDFEETPFRVQRVLEDWVTADQEVDGVRSPLPLRAGISSFGAGGANAHLIVEAYPSAGTGRPEAYSAPQVILLSAWDEERLRALAGRLHRALISDRTLAGALADIAFTLQVGRRAMNSRLALVVSSSEQLIARLDEFVRGAPHPDRAPVFRGQAKEDRAKLATLFEGPSGTAMVESMLQNRHLEKLASIWVMGIEVDWSKLPTDRGDLRRISLPTYPFKANRYWLRGPAGDRRRLVAEASALQAAVVFESSLEGALAFRSTLSTSHPILDQHKIEGERVWPGVGLLELVIQTRGWANRVPLEISDVVWLVPVRGQGDQAELFTVFRDKQRRRWELCDRVAEPRTVFAQGNIIEGGVWPQATPLVDVDQVRTGSAISQDGKAFYAAWQARGIDYGPLYRGVRSVWRKKDDLVAEIGLDEAVFLQAGRCCLHPGLMDSLLQAGASLFLRDGAPGAPLLPFAVESVRIYQALPNSFLALARREGEHCRLQAITRQGEVLVEVQGLAVRAAPSGAGNQALFAPLWTCEPAVAGPGTPAVSRRVLVVHRSGQEGLAEQIARCHPRDRVQTQVLGLSAEPLAAPSTSGRGESPLGGGVVDLLYFLGGLDVGPFDFQDEAAFRQARDRGVHALRRVLQALRRGDRMPEAFELRVATRGALATGGTGLCWQSGLAGFCQSLQQEFPAWRVTCVDFDFEVSGPAQREAWARAFAEEPPTKRGEAVAFAQGRRLVRRLTPIQLRPAPAENASDDSMVRAAASPSAVHRPGGPAVFEDEGRGAWDEGRGARDEGRGAWDEGGRTRSTEFRLRGVYLILGGAGGIGAELSYYLASKYGARLILIGRSPLDAGKEAQLGRIRQLGGDGIYVAADATSFPELQAAVGRGRRAFGEIHGVFHSAIVLEDRGLFAMAEDSFEAAWKPKADASVHLARALAGSALDFMVFFSSALSFFGNPGQGNYVAGCGFQDDFGRALSTQVPYPVCTVNWGYWGTVGIVAGPGYQKRMFEQGFLSIGPEDGFDALERVLGLGLDQAVYVRAKPGVLAMMGVDFARVQRVAPAAGEPLLSAVPDRFAHLALRASRQDWSDFMGGMKELDALCGLASLGVFQEVLPPNGEAFTRGRLREALRAVPKYHPLLDSLLDQLTAQGRLQVGADGTFRIPESQGRLLAETIRAASERLRTAWPSVDRHLRLLLRCLESVPEVLSGAVQATDVLFPEASLEWVHPIYQDNPAADDFNHVAAECLDRLIEGRATNRNGAGPFRILEIGAGTGGTSAWMLERIQRRGDGILYTYTDISARFLQHGEERFGRAHRFVDFKRLDIERSVDRQGFQPGGYDVVIATNVLHATPDLERTLRNVKNLLRRNGVLILNEVSRTDLFLSLTFGLLDGWWKFRDPRLPGGPLLDGANWRRLLARQGFHSVRVPEGQARWSELPAAQCVLLAESDGILRLETNAREPGDAERTAAQAVERATPSGDETAVSPTALAPRLSVPRPSEVRVEPIIRGVLAQVLQIDPKEFDADAPYTDFGVDSILAVKIIQELNERLGTRLRSTDLFSYTSIAQLAQHLEADLAQTAQDHTDGLGRRSLGEGGSSGASLPRTDESTVPQAAGWGERPREPFREYSNSVNPVDGRTDGSSGASPHRTDESTRPRDIAVIGLAGQFPGARNLDEFWSNLVEGRNAIREVDALRWDPQVHFHPEPNQPNKTYSKWGGWLDDIDLFDPLFFNISPREAQYMDPKQRLFLQAAWTALEDAGQVEGGSARKCGVFVGCSPGDYKNKLKEHGVAPETYTFVGNSESILAARISYFLGLQGPAITLDTACSSSLMAVQLACESLRSGACDLAVAGGVCVLTTAEFHILASQSGMLSPTGQCQAFDHRADGFVPAEGVGAVVLKDLGAALRDGDTIHAVINGGAANQDGRTNGITAPSAAAQTRLELEVYERSGLNPEQIQYVEAHGTGTKLGDPIEVNALIDAFRTYTPRKQFCGIGSVKTNVGHCLAAAGMAGLLKVILCLKHVRHVPSLHLERPNEHIPFADSPFYVVTEARPWETPPHQPRQAAISSFGFSGTNVHLAVREAVRVGPARQASNLPCYPVVFSAKSARALRARLEAFLDWMSCRPEVPALDRVSYSSLKGRGQFPIRQAFLVADWNELRDGIQAVLRGNEAPQAWSGDAEARPVEIDPAKLTAAAGFLETARAVSAEECRRGLAEACELWASGYALDLSRIFGEATPARITLPTYAFDRKSYWIPGVPVARPASAPSAEGKTTPSRHPLVHDRDLTASGGKRFESAFDGSEFFFQEHRIGGRAILPGVAVIEMAREAGARASGLTVTGLRNLVWLSPLTHPGHDLKVEVILEAQGDQDAFVVKSGAPGLEVVHAQGRLVYARPGMASLEAERVDLAAIRNRCGNRWSGAACYERFEAMQLQLGPHFRVVQELVMSETECLAELSLESRNEPFHLHPGMLDGLFQSVVGLWGARVGSIRVPYSLEELTVFGPTPAQAYAHVVTVPSGGNGSGAPQKFDLQLISPSGTVILRVRGFYPRAFQDGSAKPTPAPKGLARDGLLVPAWTLAPQFGPGAAVPPPGACVLFVASDAIRPEFQKRFNPGGATAFIEVRPGDRYRYLGNQVYEINPARREDHERLLTALSRQGHAPGSILHFWAEGRALPAAEDSGSDVPWPVRSFIHLGQSLLNAQDKTGQPVKLVYACSVQAPGQRPAHLALSGLIRCLNRESASVRASQIELPPAAAPAPSVLSGEVVAALGRELFGNTDGSRHPEILLRQGERFERTWQRAATNGAPEPKVGLRAGGTYLITGGLGGVGRVLADHLARDYRPTLILWGRSPIDAGMRERIAHWEGQGARVRYFACDVADQAQVREGVRELEREGCRLNGIFHCAGVLADSYLARKTPAEFESALKPKMAGIRNLDQATIGHPLDLVVLFSSLAAITGNPGQADYAYANAFLNGFAEYRETLRQQGQRAGVTLSINWPLWEQGGMAVDRAHAAANPARGLSPLTGDQGWDLLVAALEAGRSGICTGHVNPTALLALLNGEPSNGRDPEPGPRPASPQVVPVGAKGASANGALANLVALFKQWVCEIMEVEPGAVLERKALGAYGFDSISFARLADKVNRRFQLEVSPALFFEFPTLDSVARHLLQAHGLAAAWPAETAPEPRLPEVANLGVEPVPVAVAAAAVPSPASREPIAVIGMSGVFPESPDLETFWEHLREGRWLIREIPADRWDWRAYAGDPATEDNKTRVKFGGFMPGVDHFDAGFFGISPREADLMDPQQRLFMQTVWHTVEDAGYRASELAGRPVGVFVGVSTGDYYELLRERGIRIEAHTSTGMAHSMLANRVSYHFDWHGPSEPVDTACSSSLIALHRAVESLWSGQCELAIAGGVNAILTPTLHISFGKAGMLAEDGKCKTFDERADGYVRGEGCGAVLLKPLGQALRDGDRIQAVIRSSQVNHGGRANSLTAPNPQAQSRLIAQALREAGVDASTISYVEAHGTGTRLGDPIEIRGLTAAFAQATAASGPVARRTGYCGLGSAKTNVGHLEAAAGIAGLIKVVLALQHQQIPATLHFQRLNPHIQLEGTPFHIVEATRAWEPLQDRDGQAVPRRAGLSSFGFGGANAHVVLEEAPPARRAIALEGPSLMVLSARNENRLKALAQRMQTFLQARKQEARPDEKAWMTSLSYTLQTGREPMEVRLAVLARDPAEWLTRLGDYLEGRASPGWWTGSTVGGGAGEAQESAAGGAESAFISELARQRKWERLAGLWVQGTAVPWRECYGAERPGKMALPGYPFAPERHWIPEAKGRNAGRAQAQHPWLGEIESLAGVGTGVAFAKSFVPEDPVCRDHHVRGRSILPAVAYLEMAVAAAHRGTSLRRVQITQACWLQPVLMEGEPRRLSVALKPDGPGFEFQVTSEGPGGKPVVHSTGKLADLGDAFSDRASVVPQNFQRQARRSVLAAELYRELSAKGYEYGDWFRGVRQVWIGDGDALSEIEIPPAAAGEASPFWLHPTIMDGALQTLSVFYGKLALPILPFSVERVEVAAPCGRRCFAYVRREGEHRFFIEILDENGRVCVRLHDFCYLEWAGEREGLFYASRWVHEERKADGAAGPSHTNERGLTGVLVIGSAPTAGLAQRLTSHFASMSTPSRLIDVSPWLEGTDARLGAAELTAALDQAIRSVPNVRRIYWVWDGGEVGGQREVAEALGHRHRALVAFYRILKTLTAHPLLEEGCQFHFLTCSALPVFGDESGCPAGAAMWGLLRSVEPECPAVEFRCLDVEVPPTGSGSEGEVMASLVNAIAAEPTVGQQNQVSFRAGRRYVRKLEPVEFLGMNSWTAPAFRRGGLYVIVGWRGLGRVLAEHLQKAHGARVVLLGRSAWDDSKRTLFERHAQGPAWRYFQADVGDAQQCEAVFARIRRDEGPIHGVIHAAMELQDQSFHRMEESSFLAAVSAKSIGIANLLQALKADALDFVLMFSSLQSWVTNPGQGNYVAGCCFQDLAGRSVRDRLPFPVRVINWGYWGSVGAVADAAYQERIRALHLESLSPVEGMEAMDRFLASGLEQCFVVKAQAGFLDRYQIGRKRTRQALPGRSSLAGVWERQRPEWNVRACLEFQQDLARLERWGRVLLAHRLRRAGCWSSERSPRTLLEWSERLQVVEPYSRWLPLLWRMLAEEGLGSMEGQGFRLLDRHRLDAWFEANPAEAADSISRGAPAMAPFARLLQACVEALPEIISGRTRATEVLFPNGSMELVSAIYQRNEFSDAFNQIALQTILAYVEARLGTGGETIRILEVGAGSGGTSEPVLAALQRHGGRLSYCYTDISDSFLQHGRRVLGAAHPFVEFRPFNVEQDAAAQGFEAGQFDVVLASNVLHATRNIRRTLRNLQPLLKAGGWLVLNEAMRAQDFLNLTFGLTSGWWLFEDAEERLAHSPLLQLSQWRRILREEGFGRVHLAGVPWNDPLAAELRQHVLVAETSGVIVRRPEQRNDVNQTASARPGRSDVEDRAEATDRGRATAVAIASSPARTDGGEPAVVERVVRESLQKVLETARADFEARQPFSEFGVDSILGVEVIHQINQRLGIRLRTTDFFNFATIEKLARHIRESCPEWAGNSAIDPLGSAAMPGRERAPVPGPVHLRGTNGKSAPAADPLGIFAQLEAGELDVDAALAKLRGGGW